MSNPTNSLSSPLSDEIAKNIDQLNLSIIQKHHVRLLAHCLVIFKDIAQDEISLFEEDELLRKWCEKQSQQFNDKKFNSVEKWKKGFLYPSIDKSFKSLKYGFSFNELTRQKDYKSPSLDREVQFNRIWDIDSLIESGEYKRSLGFYLNFKDKSFSDVKISNLKLHQLNKNKLNFSHKIPKHLLLYFPDLIKLHLLLLLQQITLQSFPGDNSPN